MKRFKVNDSKKAISPVITTVLLILMVLVLAAIIIVWWKSFIGESITKFNSDGKPKSIEQFCTDVKLAGSLSAGSVSVVNSGSVPVYKVGFQKVTKTTTTMGISDTQIIAGASKTIPLPTNIDDINTGAGDKLYLIPILLGNNDKGQQKEFQCPKSTWKQIV